MREEDQASRDLLGELAAEPTFRGCAFVKASSEGARGETKVTQVCTDTRAWTRGLFVDLAREAGAANPDDLGRRLVVLYDGAIVGAAMDRNPAAVTEARAMAEVLLDAYAPAGHTSKRGAPRSSDLRMTNETPPTRLVSARSRRKPSRS